MDAQTLIQIYQTGFYICMAVTIVGILLAVLFFFWFRIGIIWSIQTGKAQKKAVQNMQESSRQNGRMRQEETHHSELSIQEEVNLKATDSLEPDPPLKKTDSLESGLKETEVLQQENFGETEILPQTSYGATEVLPQTGRLEQTTVLYEEPAVIEKMDEHGLLTITQEVVLIHTDEKI